MGYILRGHPGSGDHGSEDRARGTCAVLEDIEICSARPEEDWHYGLGKLAALRQERTRGGLVLSNGERRVLWDWTGPIPQNPERYARIFTADRRSLSRLAQAGLQEKARLGPDPIFLVERQLPPVTKHMVGFCGWPEVPYPFGRTLIQWLLPQKSVAMIPYRVRDVGLQRVLARGFNEERITCRPDGSCLELRRELARCACVIGSPAAVMAAWSCGVPGLCIGFSPRAVGLAEELFGRWEGAVVPIASLRQEQDLTLAFRCFLATMDDQWKALEIAVPDRRDCSLQWNPQELER